MTTLTETANPREETRLDDVASETYCCPLCSGKIAPECVHGKSEDDPRTGHILRNMGVFCDHCSAVFRIKLKIAPMDGRLVPAGRWERVNDAKGRAEFLSKCDAARFNVQLKPQTKRRS